MLHAGSNILLFKRHLCTRATLKKEMRRKRSQKMSMFSQKRVSSLNDRLKEGKYVKHEATNVILLATQRVFT